MRIILKLPPFFFVPRQVVVGKAWRHRLVPSMIFPLSRRRVPHKPLDGAGRDPHRPVGIAAVVTATSRIGEALDQRVRLNAAPRMSSQAA
jgi:hypothetical protein